MEMWQSRRFAVLAFESIREELKGRVARLKIMKGIVRTEIYAVPSTLPLIWLEVWNLVCMIGLGAADENYSSALLVRVWFFAASPENVLGRMLGMDKSSISHCSS